MFPRIYALESNKLCTVAEKRHPNALDQTFRRKYFLSFVEIGGLGIETSNFVNKNCIDPFIGGMAKLLEEEPEACLISDAVWHFAQVVAESLKLPMIVLRIAVSKQIQTPIIILLLAPMLDMEKRSQT
ncbi:hypothetical protein Tco_0189716 [Tanacetum coccineum]